MQTIYDNQNIFAKILRGESDCFKVYEDEHSLAFMDIMPLSEGHVLVIPKTPARNIFDIPAKELGFTMVAAQKIACAQMEALKADGISIQQSNESAAGQVVFHLHIHLIPRFEGRPYNSKGCMGDEMALARQATQIAEAIS